MNILIKNPEEREKLLSKWRDQPSQFTQMVHSTTTVMGSLKNVKINEAELVDIECDGNIVRIDSNYYHAIAPGYESPAVQRKSNRGRKSKPKVKKRQRVQGDGSCFNSQVTFTVLGSHTRVNPEIHYQGETQKLRSVPKEASVKKLDGDVEILTKKYKFKLFRPGTFQLPGVLTDDLSDGKLVIADVCEFLSDLFDDEITCNEMSTSLRNYKMITKYGKIDLLKFQDYCNRHFTSLLNTRFERIAEFIMNPAWMSQSDTKIITSEPQLLGDFLGVYRSHKRLQAAMEDDPPADSDDDKMVFNFGDFYEHLTNCTTIKNLYVNFSELCRTILANGILDTHYLIDDVMEQIYQKYFVNFDDDVVDRIRRVVLAPKIAEIENQLSNSKNNMASHIRYKPGIYPGFSVKIKTPTKDKPKKMTTIKLFPSGKINIDGAGNRDEVEFLYWWLNNIFYQNPQFIYREDDPDETDDEFSISDSE